MRRAPVNGCFEAESSRNRHCQVLNASLIKAHNVWS
jgi:hypothetical protein